MGRAVRILRAVFHDMHMPEMAMKNAGEQGDKEKNVFCQYLSWIYLTVSVKF